MVHFVNYSNLEKKQKMKIKKKLSDDSSNSNAQFFSKLQNWLINIFSDMISEKITDKVNRAKIFSAMADEIT